MLREITTRQVAWLSRLLDPEMAREDWFCRVHLEDDCAWSTDGVSLLLVGDRKRVVGPSDSPGLSALMSRELSIMLDVPVQVVRVLGLLAADCEKGERRVEFFLEDSKCWIKSEDAMYEVTIRGPRSAVGGPLLFKIDPLFFFRALSEIEDPKIGFCNDTLSVYVDGSIDEVPCRAIVMSVEKEHVI